MTEAATHLCWIHNRMVNVHGENPYLDYMIRFREIIAELNDGEMPTMMDLLLESELNTKKGEWGEP